MRLLPLILGCCSMLRLSSAAARSAFAESPGFDRSRRGRGCRAAHGSWSPRRSRRDLASPSARVTFAVCRFIMTRVVVTPSASSAATSAVVPDVELRARVDQQGDRLVRSSLRPGVRLGFAVLVGVVHRAPRSGGSSRLRPIPPARPDSRPGRRRPLATINGVSPSVADGGSAKPQRDLHHQDIAGLGGERTASLESVQAVAAFHVEFGSFVSRIDVRAMRHERQANSRLLRSPRGFWPGLFWPAGDARPHDRCSAVQPWPEAFGSTPFSSRTWAAS